MLGRDSGYLNQSSLSQPGIEPKHCLTHAVDAESMKTEGHPTDAQCVRVRMYDGNVGYFTVAISQSDSFLTPLQAPCCFATLHASQWRLITLAHWPLTYAAEYSSEVALLAR